MLLYFVVKNLVLWARSEILGFALANNVALNPKHEIRISKQYKMTKIQITQNFRFCSCGFVWVIGKFDI
jgi:hypothetical protein